MEEGVVGQLQRGALGAIFSGGGGGRGAAGAGRYGAYGAYGGGGGEGAGGVVTAASGAGNNWGVGYAQYGRSHGPAVLDALRAALEAADSPQAALLLHAAGGGTGSGLGSWLVGALADAEPELYRLTATVLPAATDDVVTSPYNAVLTLAALREHADVVMAVENDALAGHPLAGAHAGERAAPRSPVKATLAGARRGAAGAARAPALPPPALAEPAAPASPLLAALARASSTLERAEATIARGGGGVGAGGAGGERRRAGADDRPGSGAGAAGAAGGGRQSDARAPARSGGDAGAVAAGRPSHARVVGGGGVAAATGRERERGVAGGAARAPAAGAAQARARTAGRGSVAEVDAEGDGAPPAGGSGNVWGGGRGGREEDDGAKRRGGGHGESGVFFDGRGGGRDDDHDGEDARGGHGGDGGGEGGGDDGADGADGGGSGAGPGAPGGGHAAPRARGSAFDGMNEVVARALADVTASMRFPGAVNMDLNELATTLVPFPRLQFLSCGLAAAPPAGGGGGAGGAAAPPAEALVEPLVLASLSRAASLSGADLARETHLALATVVRGTDAISALADATARVRRDARVVPWNGAGFKSALCSVPPPWARVTALAVSNNAAVRAPLARSYDRFLRLYRARAHLHHYLEWVPPADLVSAAHAVLGAVEEYDGFAGQGVAGGARAGGGGGWGGGAS